MTRLSQTATDRGTTKLGCPMSGAVRLQTGQDARSLSLRLGLVLGRLAAPRSPSLRSSVTRCPLLRTSFSPWFHLNSDAAHPHSLPVTEAFGAPFPARSSRGPSSLPRGPCTVRSLSAAGFLALLFPVIAFCGAILSPFWPPVKGGERKKREKKAVKIKKYS